MFLLLAVTSWWMINSGCVWSLTSTLRYSPRWATAQNKPKRWEKQSPLVCVLLLLLKMLLRNIEHSRRPKCFFLFLFLPLDVSLDGPPPPPPVSLAVWDGDHSMPSREITPVWWAAHGPPLHWLRWSTPRTPTSDRFSAETPQSDSASGGVLGILNSTPGF